MTLVTRVAVGVLRNANDEVLLAVRPPHVSLPGLWEFPGGKVEPGESIQQALARELKEEVGIEVKHAIPLLQVQHDYGKGPIALDVWQVLQFTGVPQGKEGQWVQWMARSQLTSLQFPAANQLIIQAVLAL